MTSDLFELILDMFHNEFYGHAVLAPTGNHNVCMLHGGFYELLEGLKHDMGREHPPHPLVLKPDIPV